MNAPRRIIAAAVFAAVAVSAACKDTTEPKVMVAAEDAVVTMNSTVTSALSGVLFNFPGGAGALSPAVASNNLALTFGGTTTAPTAAIVITSPTGAPVGSFTANVSFGSCIFVVSGSTFPAGHALANGQTITVNPCSVNLNTAGGVANGQPTSRSAALLLGAAASQGTTVTVGINPNGQIVLNGSAVTSIRLTPVSG